jgi:hypothetical protein
MDLSHCPDKVVRASTGQAGSKERDLDVMVSQLAQRFLA